MPNLAEELPTIGSIDDPHSTAPALTPEDVFSAPHPPHPARRRRRSRLTLPLMFCLGIAATIGWDSYGDRIREAVAGMPQPSWMPRLLEQFSFNVPPQQTAAPPAAVVDQAPAPSAIALDQRLSAASQDLDAVRQDVERIATAQDQIIRSIGQLAAGQEQMTKEITKLQAVEQYILYKNSEAPPAAAPATTAAVAAPAAPARTVPVRRTTTPTTPPPANNSPAPAAAAPAPAPTQAR